MDRKMGNAALAGHRAATAFLHSPQEVSENVLPLAFTQLGVIPGKSAESTSQQQPQTCYSGIFR